MPLWLGYLAFGMAFAGFIFISLFRAYTLGVVFLLIGAAVGILTITGH